MAGKWTAGIVDPPSSGAPEPDEWTEVQVPGRPEEFAGADAVVYRTTFGDPRSSPDQRTILELAGVFAHAEVWLDGERLGRHDAYFVPARFEFEPAETNDLRVVCRAPEDRFGGIYGTDRVPDERAVPGIWWDAKVRVRPPTYVADLSLTPRRTDEGAAIDAAVTVDSADGIEDRITLSLRPKGFRGGGAMERVPIDVPAGERSTARQTIPVRDPSPWWPHGLGDQHRYVVRAKLRDDEATATTGFCDVERTEDALLINGQPVSLRGFALLPSADPAADVAAAREANATVLRAYGHVPRPAFHEACTEEGIVVWQDLPLVGPGPVAVERGRTLATALADEIGQHPSVAVYSAHTDPADPFPDPIGSGRLSRLRLRWRAWRTDYDRDPAERVGKAFPDRAVTLPVAGALGTNPDATAMYPGWSFGSASDVEWVLDRYPSLGRFVGEFGAESLANDVDRRSDHIDWQVHDRFVDEEDADASQAYQARLLKTIVEALRRRGSSLQTAYCLRDQFPTGGSGVLAADGERKSAFEAVAESFEPVQAILNGPPGEADGVVVDNDTGREVTGHLEWTVGTTTGSTDVTVPARGRTVVDEAPVGEDGRIALTLTVDDREISNQYAF